MRPAARLCERVAPHAPIRGFHASPRVPRLLVVDKENGGGKADAVNAGINASRTPVICITDADTLIEPDALLRAVWPFVDDPLTIAVGGTICIANGSKVHRGRVVEARLPRNFLALVQTLEYERAFMLARLGPQPPRRTDDRLGRVRAVPARCGDGGRRLQPRARSARISSWW